MKYSAYGFALTIFWYLRMKRSPYLHRYSLWIKPFEMEQLNISIAPTRSIEPEDFLHSYWSFFIFQILQLLSQ